MLGWIPGWSTTVSPEQSTGASQISTPLSPPLDGRIIEYENGEHSIAISIDDYIPSNCILETKIQPEQESKIDVAAEPESKIDVVAEPETISIKPLPQNSYHRSRMFLLYTKIDPNKKLPGE